MGWINKLAVLSFAVCTFSVQADVNISLHQDLELLVISEENSGFSIFGDNTFKLKNGKSQVVVRVSKLVFKYGEKEKFKSEPLILSFDLNDVDLEISPARNFMRIEEVNGFDKKPIVIVTQNGKSVEVKQELLKRGSGISRDYAAELKAQNGFVESTDVASVAVVATTPVKKAPASPIKMSEDLFAKASSAEKEQFTDWAFKNRKAIKAPLDGEGKILPMLEYWYEKASADEKAEILTWILAQ
jgi:uncharacterized protein YccT (UPF0319 family)